MTTFEYICYLIGYWFVIGYLFCIAFVLILLVFGALAHFYEWFKNEMNNTNVPAYLATNDTKIIITKQDCNREECTAEWIPESRENNWRSSCSKCGRKAYGSCQ